MCGFLLGELGKQVPALSFFPPFEFELPKAQQILKVSGIFVGMITFNNLCLQYVEVHFYQVARSLSIFFNVLFSKFVLGQDTSPKVRAPKAVSACACWLLGRVGQCSIACLDEAVQHVG